MRYFRTAMLTVAAAGALALGLGATSASAATTNLKIAPGTAIDVTFPESVSCPGGVTGDVVIVVKSGHQNMRTATSTRRSWAAGSSSPA